MGKRNREMSDKRHNEGFSRRSFLKSAGTVAGLAFLAGGGLATAGCSPNSSSVKSAQTIETPNGSYEVYETDLLVCGCGYGGMSAASFASKSGLNTIVVEKGPFGSGGVAGMNFDFLITWIFDPNFYKLDSQISPILNQEVNLNARKLNEQENALNPALQGYTGANLDSVVMNNGQMFPERNADGSYHVFLRIDARKIDMVEGSFPRHEQYKLTFSPWITIFDQTMLTDFIIEDGVCMGAMGIYLPTGAFRVYRAKATVMATGGCCWINGWNTVAPQSGSVPDNTSDLEIAAFRHGAAILDSEWADYDLITVYPTGISCGYPAGFGADSMSVNYILDADKKKFLVDEADPFKYQKSRTLFLQTVGQTIANGKASASGGVYVDYATEEARSQIRYFYRRNIELFQDIFGIDPTKDVIECGLEMIEHQGNIEVDGTAMSKDFAGLFCTRGGGMTGAAGSPGVSHNYLYGTYAMAQAVDYAKAAKLPELPLGNVENEYKRVTDIRTNPPVDKIRPVQIRRAIQKAAGTCMGIIRKTADLEAARDELARIRKEDLPKQAVSSPSAVYNMEWKEAIENYNLLTISELSVLSTLTREESRGSYLRPEFPEKARIGHADWQYLDLKVTIKHKKLIVRRLIGMQLTGPKGLRRNTRKDAA